MQVLCAEAVLERILVFGVGQALLHFLAFNPFLFYAICASRTKGDFSLERGLPVSSR